MPKKPPPTPPIDLAAKRARKRIKIVDDATTPTPTPNIPASAHTSDTPTQPLARIARTRRPGQRLTAEERAGAQELFLQQFQQSGNISAACRAAAIERHTFYRWKEEDGAFLVAYKYAEEQAVDILEMAARQRAVSGVERVVVSMGKVVMVPDPSNPERMIPLTQREYSDSVLLALLRAHNPKFRDRSHVDVTSGGERLEMRSSTVDDPEAAALARALIARVTAGLTSGSVPDASRVRLPGE